MARLIVKSPYFKGGGAKQAGGYLRYIGEIDGEHVMRHSVRFLRRLAGGCFAQRSGKRLAVNGPVRFADV